LTGRSDAAHGGLAVWLAEGFDWHATLLVVAWAVWLAEGFRVSVAMLPMVAWAVRLAEGFRVGAATLLVVAWAVCSLRVLTGAATLVLARQVVSAPVIVGAVGT